MGLFGPLADCEAVGCSANVDGGMDIPHFRFKLKNEVHAMILRIPKP